jgi:hypothetical protein
LKLFPPSLILKALVDQTGADFAIAIGYSPPESDRVAWRLLAYYGVSFASTLFKDQHTDEALRELIGKQATDEIIAMPANYSPEGTVIRESCELYGAKYLMMSPIRRRGIVRGSIVLLWSVEDVTFSSDQQNSLQQAAIDYSPLVDNAGFLLAEPSPNIVAKALEAEVAKYKLADLASAIVGITTDQVIVWWQDKSNLFGYNGDPPLGSSLGLLFESSNNINAHQSFIDAFLNSEDMIKKMGSQAVKGRDKKGQMIELHVKQIRKVPIYTGMGLIALIDPVPHKALLGIERTTTIESNPPPDILERRAASVVKKITTTTKVFNDSPIGALITILLIIVLGLFALIWTGKINLTPSNHARPETPR